MPDANRPPELEYNVRTYLNAGVQLVWIVDPTRRTIQGRTPDGNDLLLIEEDELTGGDVHPDFRVEVA